MQYQKAVRDMIGWMNEAARKEIMPRFGKVLTATRKSHHQDFKDVVTEADVGASEYILERARTSFPGSYSEEHKYDDRFDNDLIWQVDPVDGTDEFLAGMLDGFASHAALLKRQPSGTYFPVAGIIYRPGLDRLWYNDGQETVFRKGGRAGIPVQNKDQLRGWERKLDPNDKLAEFYKYLGRKLLLPITVVPGGGAGASVSDMLEGKTNLVVMNYNYTKEWDLAMAEPIVASRGGFICDLDGNPFTYNRQDTEHGEPYNQRGYVISIIFKKHEIIPRIPKDLLIDRLTAKNE